ncbi:MAG: hypothetical protein AB8B53_12895 [Flavobacteriales bacterium]
MNYLNRLILLLLAVLGHSEATGQSDLFPLQQDFIEEAREVYGTPDSLAHSSLLPFSIKSSQLQNSFFIEDSAKYYSVAKAKLFRDDLISVKEPDFKLAVNPLFHFSKGFELSDTSAYSDTINLYRNIRGFKIDGQIGKRMFFSTSFLENIVFLPSWQRAYADSSLVIPGMGRHKDFKDSGFDYGVSNGWLSYYPAENLNLFFGHGKQFIGHGYRSHILSHQSFNYPHLKSTIILLKGKLQVMWSLAGLQTLERKPLGEVPESLFKRKAATFSNISYLLGRHLELSVAEVNTWRRYDDDTGSLPLEYTAYLPVPFLGAVIKDSPGHQSRIAANLLIKASPKLQLYAQSLIGAQSFQAGVRVNNLLLNGLRVNLEYNQSRNVQEANSLVDFTHFNENLGHPLSANFEEFISRIMYRNNRWNGSVTYTLIDADSKRNTLNFVAGYLMNPKTNFNITLGYLNRTQNVENEYTSGVIQIGMSTSVVDTLFDF